MKVTGIACDVCEKFQATETDQWFNVRRNGMSVDVCSPECLRKLGTQLKNQDFDLESTSHSEVEMTYNCDECERAFATQQGLSMHITRTHGRD